MKTIIAGSRKISNIDLVLKAIRDSKFYITELVSGCAPGIDQAGIRWAENLNRVWGPEIPITRFPANWDDISGPGAVIAERRDGSKYNLIAGLTRNQQMADYADALILIWDGKSSGSADMLKRAKAQQEKRQFKIHEYIVNESTA